MNGLMHRFILLKVLKNTILLPDQATNTKFSNKLL